MISILYVLLDRLVAIQRSGEVYERMSVRVQVGCSVAQLSKQESKEMMRVRGNVAKKESGRVWYYLHMHKSDDAIGIGRDGCGWAESSYRPGGYYCGTSGLSVSRNSASKLGVALCCGTYMYIHDAEHTFTRHSSAIPRVMESVCSLVRARPMAGGSRPRLASSDSQSSCIIDCCPAGFVR